MDSTKYNKSEHVNLGPDRQMLHILSHMGVLTLNLQICVFKAEYKYETGKKTCGV